MVPKFLSYGQKNLVFAHYGSYWRNVRKMCTLELPSNHKINSFKSSRKEEVGLLIEYLKEADMINVSRVFDGFFERIIDEHLKPMGEKKAGFLDVMLNLMNSECLTYEYRIDRSNVKAIIMDMLGAAMDTSVQ
ncbi:cytochrome P450 CYP736A12-like protein [Cucumis melo var. makuwa]|uniref:Cytochrome P450 CYP736A12-like protein n=1 Tax=Cucumis melo var. makuwa TaxID=1194695 RepID=A0A5A7T473_CUCMM|nr:cytochrome P450 CYP736A12-like protein [Cucumis melo var. makuwa]